MHIFMMYFPLVLALLSFVWYLFYLTWPVVEGGVKATTNIVVPGMLTPPKKFRIVRFRYRFEGKEYSATRASLFTRRGLAPRVNIGDRIKVSVCIDLPQLTCPRRAGFDGLVVLLIVLFCMTASILAYERVYDRWPSFLFG